MGNRLDRPHVPRAKRASRWNRAAYDAARRDAGLTWQALAEAVNAEGFSSSTTALYAYAYHATRMPPAALVPILARILKVPARRLAR